jgi:hypothetical protein
MGAATRQATFGTVLFSNHFSTNLQIFLHLLGLHILCAQYLKSDLCISQK